MRKCLIFLLLITALVSVSSAAVLEVGPGKTYTTIQAGINAANAGDSVHVTTGTYTLTNAITINKRVNLYGDGAGKTIIKVDSDSVGSTSTTPGYIYITGTSYAEVSGFTIQGPAASISDQIAMPHISDYQNGIAVANSNHIKIHDISETLLLSDGVKMAWGGSSYVDVYNMYIVCDNHDGVQVWGGNYVHIYNCYIDTIHNCVFRFANCQNCVADRITGTTSGRSSGWTGAELEGTSANNTVHHCVFQDMGGNYWAACTSSSTAGTPTTGTASLHDNKLYSTGGYALTSSGFTATLSNNENAGSINSAWGSMGYGYDSTGVYTPSNVVLPVYDGVAKCTPIAPANNAIITTTNGNVSFVWSDLNSTNYCVGWDNNSGFTNTVANNWYTFTNGSTNSLQVPLSNGTYYWHVTAYDDVHHTWSAVALSDTYKFTVSGDTVVIPYSGIYGYVYNDNRNTPIQYAVVTLRNDSWGQHITTTENGYYSFSVPKDSGVYYLSAGATGYQSTGVEIPVNTTGEAFGRDIPLIKTPSYFPPHNVQFIVYGSSWLSDPIPGATVSAYIEGNSPINGVPDFTGVTSTMDESVTFSMVEDVNYTIVTTYGSVSETETVYPVASKYKIHLPIDYTPPQLPASELISINVTKTAITNNAADINIIYTDNSSVTNDVQFSLGTYTSDNKFIAAGIPGTKDNWTAAEMTNHQATDTIHLTDCIGKSYVIRVTYNTTTSGYVVDDYAVRFPGSQIPFSDQPAFAYACIIICLMIGSAFGYVESKIAPIITTIIAGIMYGLGCFVSLDQVYPNGSTIMGVLIGVTFLMSVAVYMKGDGQ